MCGHRNHKLFFRKAAPAMRILYLRNTGFQCDPHEASIYQAKQKDWEIRSFDYYCANSDERILEQARQFMPTHVVWLGVCGGAYETRKETFKELRRNARTIALVPEASHPDWDRLIQTFYDYDCFDLIVNLDGNSAWNDRGMGLTTLAIYDQRPYAKYRDFEWRKRPIDVGFCGGSGSFGTMRQKLTDHLREAGVLTELRFVDIPGTYQVYADFLMNCKIVVNAAGSGNDRSLHVKGRVIEAGLAGCCLLEQSDSPTWQWFGVGSFFEFTDPEHCQWLINDLLKGSADRALCAAENLAREVRTNYSPEKLWGQIFERVN